MPATSYAVTVYGGPTGHEGKRAAIFLNDGKKFVGSVAFYGGAIPASSQGVGSSGELFMSLPTSLLGVVLDILRNEKPIDYVHESGTFKLGTLAGEPVGEGE